MQQVDTALADLHLAEASGDNVRLGDLWRDGTAVVVWLRHYR